MLRLLRKLRKGFKTACLTATLATCWQIGQAAKADTSSPNWGDEVTYKFTGTVSPSTNGLSHMFLIYGTGSSGTIDFPLGFISLGSFQANQTTSFSALGNARYNEFVWWCTAGLYGDTSSGQYIEGTNGVTLGILASEGDSWDLRSPILGGEANAFTCLLNNTPENMTIWEYVEQGWHVDEPGTTVLNTSSDLFNFSQATGNGQIEFTIEIVPEPVSIVLFGTGGMIITALRRRQ
jgi:type 1 fimbria pilin